MSSHSPESNDDKYGIQPPAMSAENRERMKRSLEAYIQSKSPDISPAQRQATAAYALDNTWKPNPLDIAAARRQEEVWSAKLSGDYAFADIVDRYETVDKMRERVAFEVFVENHPLEYPKSQD